jgi:hypothetical protein
MSAKGSTPVDCDQLGEGPSLTQSVNCEFSGLDRNGLVRPSYPGLETIRYQTLPMRSQISGYRAKAALP